MRVKVSTEEEWLELRKQCITATESSCLVGADPYRSMQKAWNEKQFGTFQGNAYTKIGQILEPAVVNATNLMLNEDFKLFEQEKDEKIFYIDKECKLGATPDAHNDKFELLECKTTKPLNQLRYGNSPPEPYLVQMMTQFHCSDAEKGYLAIMSTDLSTKGPELDLPISIFKVEKDDVICNLLCSESARFWDMQEQGKMFRVDSKVKRKVKLRLQMCYRRVI